LTVLITLTVNEKNYNLEIDDTKTLMDVLREDLGLYGVKKSCNEGECGACTVLIDGKAVNSCMTLAASVDNKQITTIEGIEKNNDLHPLQKAFIKYGAVQCGYCSPGMVLTSIALLNENPNPTINEIKEALQGNLCRCTGYQQIIDAVYSVGKSRNK
jgi:carbon-monoxide dehydrogenase small subunit